MASASLPAQEAPAHFTPGGSSILADGEDEEPPSFFLPPPLSVRKNTAPITTSTPTTPARSIVSLRRPAPEEGSPPGRGPCGGWPGCPGRSGWPCCPYGLVGMPVVQPGPS